CSPVEQGISSGYTDIYSENLDGMWVDIPPGTCNGDYWVVIEADPHDVFLEENETNNWAAIPVTLTQQVPAGQGLANITYSGDTHLCAGETLTLTANAGTDYAWSTGDSTPSITVTQSGTYEVTVTSACGVATSTPIAVTIEDPVTPPATAATNNTVCYNQPTTVTASGTATGYRWFDAMTGGNLLIDNASFTTPNLTATTTFYAEAYNLLPGAIVHGGPLDNTIGTGGNYTQTTRYLIFDVLQPCELVSVWVLAGAAGTRNIQLRDDTGAVLDSAVVQVPQGASRVNLNFSLATGTNYQLGVKAGSLVSLYRNNGGVTFPYPVSTSTTNLVNITNSSAGSTAYYFFYDWEVKAQDRLCISTPRTPIQIDVQNAITASQTLNICEGDSAMIGTAYYTQPGTYTNTYPTTFGCDSTVATTLIVNALPSPSISGLTATTYPNTVASVPMTGTPAGGTFSGPGVTGNSFNPAQAGIGGPYTIAYTYTNSEGCTATATQEVSVYDATGIEQQLQSMDLSVMPNPNNGSFKVKFELKETQNVQLALLNLAGQKVWEEKLGKVTGTIQRNVRVQQLSAGVYFFEVQTDNGNYRTKVVVE
ncbi:MAG: T9SS type A sorting domain-containing protein, partial [Bacteroidia bacterium]